MTGNIDNQELEIKSNNVTITPCLIFAWGSGHLTHRWEIESLDIVDVQEINESYFIVSVDGIGTIHTQNIEELNFSN